MTQWLLDTFVWTSALIALVLVLRRPVARHFGPQVAYALWALPLLRLLMPPLVLPASYAPAVADPAGGAVLVVLGDAPAAEPGLALSDLLLPLWLGGALLFLVWRVAEYLRMRRELLAEARPMGEAGDVRLVETPEVASPVAFGLRDKVVALPPGFMAQHDTATRDLAIAHELAHHRGHDLLANLAAQPLLALHWFNPLAWFGWRAMRSDQEAACDARVMQGRARAERAAYAEVIATFAAGPRLALAAPMACPLLGEKSIIHRLRSLSRSDVSSTRRKAGLAAIASGALVAMPLTASVSYAQEEEPANAAKVPLPEREVRIRVQREAEASPAATEPQIRRRMVIRRDGVEEVIADDLPEEMLDHEALAENACANGDATTRRELEDGRQLVIVCRRTLHDQTAENQAGMALHQAMDAIRSNDQIPPDLREEIIRDLEAEIEGLEGERLSLAPQVPAVPGGKPVLLVQARVMVMAPSISAAPVVPPAPSVVLMPAAVLRLLVPVVPEAKSAKADLPI